MSELRQRKVDCHVHVFDPERFPYPDDAFYRPSGGEIGTVKQLGAVLDSHDVDCALLVGPNSGYGLDNRCLLDALQQGKGRYKGVAVLALDAGRDELQELQAQGVVGVAFNAAMYGTDYYKGIAPLLERLRDLGMWAQMQVEHDQLVDVKPMLLDSGAKLLIDHCGRPKASAGIGHAGFAALLSMAETGRAVVKLSAPGKTSTMPYPHEDAWPYYRALLESFGPQWLVWASDWPFLRSPARIDYGPLFDLFVKLVPNEADRSAILWDTPARLFGFEAAAT